MKGKVIFSPQLAQYLLHCGFTIIELKPKYGAPNETVFVFKWEKELEAQIATWLSDEA
jgi:hypothetical protein